MDVLFIWVSVSYGLEFCSAKGRMRDGESKVWLRGQLTLPVNVSLVCCCLRRRCCFRFSFCAGFIFHCILEPSLLAYVQWSKRKGGDSGTEFIFVFPRRY